MTLQAETAALTTHLVLVTGAGESDFLAAAQVENAALALGHGHQKLAVIQEEGRLVLGQVPVHVDRAVCIMERGDGISDDKKFKSTWSRSGA